MNPEPKRTTIPLGFTVDVHAGGLAVVRWRFQRACTLHRLVFAAFGLEGFELATRPMLKPGELSIIPGEGRVPAELYGHPNALDLSAGPKPSPGVSLVLELYNRDVIRRSVRGVLEVIVENWSWGHDAAAHVSIEGTGAAR